MVIIRSKKKGFTLIEILIVLAIISLVVLLGISSYGIVQKKVRLDMAANSVQSIIAEARDKTKAGYYESADDVFEAKSLCYGFKAYPGGGVELLSTPYNQLGINRKCSLSENDIRIVKQPETLTDIVIKKIDAFGIEQADPVVVFFRPPKAEVETAGINSFNGNMIKINVGYTNTDDILYQRRVVFDVLTGTVKLQLLNENDENS